MALAKTTWTADRKISSFPRLTSKIETDVAIIGGGITGIVSAYLLAKAGKRVVVLDKGQLASIATLSTTAFITQVVDTSVADLITMFGLQKTKLIWRSHAEAIDLIEQIIKTEKINCDFMSCSNYLYAKDQDQYQELRTEQEVMKKIGYGGQLKQKPDLGINCFGYLELKQQAKFHPTKFLSAVVKKSEQLGVKFFEQTEVKEVRPGKRLSVIAAKGSVSAQYAITATYDPLNNPKETFAKKGMYVSYVMELEVPKGKYREGLYEDMENPYHYFRVDAGKQRDRIIIGGEDHRQELPVSEQKSFEALTEHISSVLGKVRYKVVRQWSGWILEPSDGLALIGQFRPRQLLASAFSGNGMTYSAIAAAMFRDIITGKKNPYQSLYDPKRTPTVKQLLYKGKDYIGEFFGGAIKNSLKQKK